jgi:ubiquinone/menaquinone biosynthesis C-methylase UbiE
MIVSKLVRNLALARSGIYLLEGLPLVLVNRWFSRRELPPPTNDQVRTVWKHIIKLHERDAENIENGVYPLRALEIENPWRHARQFLEVIADGVKVAWRMRHNQTKEFSGTSARKAEASPDYYARNFHFQTDGYFSEASARRYDHQVEILFSGAAGAMRRLILPVLKRLTSHEGRWLEIGCGAGSATRPVLETFPKARVTALDLSSSYLKVAQDTLRHYDHVDFIQGDATDLEFKSSTFDAIYSVYLLHELPSNVREQVVREAYRVLKPGGLLLFADSLQIDDTPELNWALERFPKAYHEPFYKNYSEDRIEDLLERVTGQKAQSTHEFFTKVVWIQKPLSSSLA